MIQNKRYHKGRLISHKIDGVEQLLGTRIANMAAPIAKVLKLPCIDKKTGQPRPDSGCGKMKQRLNDGMSFAEAAKLRLQGK